MNELNGIDGLKDALFSFLESRKDTLSPEARELFEISMKIEDCECKKAELVGKIETLVTEVLKIDDEVEKLIERGNELEKILGERLKAVDSLFS